MMASNDRRDWQVLLIGGSSGVGKTAVAHAVAREFGASVLLADDLRLAVQEISTSKDRPDLHQFDDPAVWSESPEALLAALISTSEALQPALEVVVAHHLAVPGVGAVVIEGDNILPSFAAKQFIGGVRHFEGLAIGAEMRAVFLVEPQEAVLLANMRSRDRGFNAMSVEAQGRLSRASWLYGCWLKGQAEARALPVLAPQPWDTLPDRIARAIDLPIPRL